MVKMPFCGDNHPLFRRLIHPLSSERADLDSLAAAVYDASRFKRPRSTDPRTGQPCIAKLAIGIGDTSL